MGVGNTGGYQPKSYSGPGAGHKRQPKGNPIGTGTESTKPAVANTRGGSTMGERGEVANNGPADRGSRLVEKTNGPGDHRQPRGQSIGAGTSKARVGESMGGGSGAFRGMKSNPLRCNNGGHRIGKR